LSALAATLLLALLGDVPLLASDEIKPVIVEHYEVSGASSSQIRKELDRLGPLGEDGVRHDGHTLWLISWTYELSTDDDGCKIESFETEIKITMTLPRWEEPDRAPARIVKRWEQYSATLRLHEDGHRDIALVANEEIKKRTKGRRSVVGCQSLGEDLNATAEAILAKYRTQEVRYDEETEHGRTQGARFP
jgi:predicted secreted Zn-dependent protease